MTVPDLRLATALALALAAPAAAQDVTMGDLLARTHVHGLHLDPADPMRLMVATHHGLFAVDLATMAATDVAGGPTDYMGFSADPQAPGTYLASGHPAGGGNLGVIRSTDGGATWEALSDGVGGPVDFHQMEVGRADPTQVWGIHHGAVLQRSRDGGATWEEVGPAPAGVIDIATASRDAETLFAATEGGLRVSRDGGLTWEAAHPAAAPVSVVDVGAGGRVLAFVLGEGWVAADEEALDWEALGAGAAGGPPLQIARDAADPDRLVVATADGRLLLSTTGGRAWSTLAVPAG